MTADAIPLKALRFTRARKRTQEPRISCRLAGARGKRTARLPPLSFAYTPAIAGTFIVSRGRRIRGRVKRRQLICFLLDMREDFLLFSIIIG